MGVCSCAGPWGKIGRSGRMDGSCGSQRGGGTIKERLPYTEDYLETASPAVDEIIQDARGGQKSG